MGGVIREKVKVAGDYISMRGGTIERFHEGKGRLRQCVTACFIHSIGVCYYGI